MGEGSELLERGHESGVVVPAAGGVDEDDIEFVRGRVRHGVLGDVGRVFAVALFVQLDFAPALALREFLEVAGVNSELLHGPGAECVAGRDQEGKVVLQEEEGKFGKVRRLADAVDSYDGNHIRARGRRERI